MRLLHVKSSHGGKCQNCIVISSLLVFQAKVKDMSGRFQQMQRDLGESKGQMARLRSDYTERINGMERAKMEVDQNLATLSHRHNYDVQNLTHQIQEQMRQISDLNGHLAAFR